MTRRRSPAPAGWTSTRYLLSVSSNFPRALLSAGFRDEVDQHKQIELFASFYCMVGEEAPEAAAHIGRNCREGPKKGGRQHSSLKQPEPTSRRRHTS